MSRRGKMALTADLVKRVHRVVADTGLPAGFAPLTDQDYDERRRALLAEHRKGDDLWLFVYGSLIWKPACEVEDHGLATLRGWHRRFCLHLERFRGTPEFPGLMMALDRGGSCRGVLQRIPARHVEERLDQLLRRETSVKPASNTPRWVRVENASNSYPAITFIINRKGLTYCRRPLTETAQILAKACGHWGSGAEYLLHTVAHLEERGIHDPYLWKLQQMVAQLIEAAPCVHADPVMGPSLDAPEILDDAR